MNSHYNASNSWEKNKRNKSPAEKMKDIEVVVKGADYKARTKKFRRPGSLRAVLGQGCQSRLRRWSRQSCRCRPRRRALVLVAAFGCVPTARDRSNLWHKQWDVKFMKRARFVKAVPSDSFVWRRLRLRCAPTSSVCSSNARKTSVSM